MIETFPDGRGLVQQPIRLLAALSVVRGYLAENDPKS